MAVEEINFPIGNMSHLSFTVERSEDGAIHRIYKMSTRERGVNISGWSATPDRAQIKAILMGLIKIYSSMEDGQ